MYYAIAAAFVVGACMSAGYYNREVALARRLLAAWKRGDNAFKSEVAAVEAEFKKLFHVK